MDRDDIALVREYAEKREENAFAQLVQRHSGLVYSAALRQVGNPALAEEVAQTVFILLARKARELRGGVVVSGWLYRAACHVSRDALKRERRREQREQEAYMQSTLGPTEARRAWEEMAPALDEAMMRLSEVERDALVLRYFEGREMRAVGAGLGTSEEAAKKRVGRAVEKLRRLLGKRNVAVSAGALAAALAAHSAEATPAGLAAGIKALALAEGAAATHSTAALVEGALKYMAWTKAKMAIGGAIVAASLVAPFVVRHQARGAVAAAHARQSDLAAALKAQRTENARLTKLAAGASLSESQLKDLPRLKQEEAALKTEAEEVAALQEDNRRLQKQTSPAPMTPMQAKELAMAKMNFGRQWLLGFIMAADKRGGEFPASFADAEASMPDDSWKNSGIATNQFEIVYQGKLEAITNPSSTIVLREIEATQTPAGVDADAGWVKTYGFADGHTEVRREAQNNFDDYESGHMIAPAAAADGQR